MITYVAGYIKTGLSESPHLLAHLLKDVTVEEMDRRPDPDRFTIREVLAHLADWEPIWHERIGRIVKEEMPNLPSYDEGQMAIDRDYAHSDAPDSLHRFATGRRELLVLLEILDVADWDRACFRDDVGTMTITEMTAMIAGHDGYHLKQIREWRQMV